VTDPLVPIIPANSRELARVNLEAVREALGRFVEAGRQAHNLLSQSAGVAASGALELHEIVVRQAGEHLQLSLELAQRLAEANGLEDALEAQRQFAQLSVAIYARQIEELSRFAAQYAPKTRPEIDPDLV